MEKQNNCINCKHFYQFYIKKDKYFSSVYYGICIKQNYKKIKPILACIHWEDISIKEEERKESIKKTIIKIHNQLKDICLLFKST